MFYQLEQPGQGHLGVPSPGRRLWQVPPPGLESLKAGREKIQKEGWFMKLWLVLTMLTVISCDGPGGGYIESAESCKHGSGVMTWDEAKEWNRRCEFDSYGTIDGKPVAKSRQEQYPSMGFNATGGMGLKVAPATCFNPMTNKFEMCM